jgi:hypothetical protein
MNKTIKFTGVAGILCLILAVPVTVFEILRGLNNLEGELVSLYIVTLLASLILYMIFIYGFTLVAEKYRNNLLKTSSYILIISAILYYGYVVLILISPNLERMLVHLLTLWILGGIGVHPYDWTDRVRRVWRGISLSS